MPQNAGSYSAVDDDDVGRTVTNDNDDVTNETNNRNFVNGRP